MRFLYLNCAMLHPVISNFTVDLFSQASATEKNSYSQFTSWEHSPLTVLIMLCNSNL